MSEQFCYITPSHTKIGVVTDSPDSEDNWEKFTGTVKLIYNKYDVVMTTDTSTTGTPTIPSAYHMALVYGALFLLGFVQFKPFFDDFVKRTKRLKTARTYHIVRQHDF